jgi:multidrug resistance efflux pump
MSDALPPIPTPPSQRWLQLRLQFLPVAVFVIGVAATALIWTRWVAPPTLVAEVEAVRAEVRSAQSGALAGVKVALLQSVIAGETIAQVVTTEPKLLEASLAVIRAELEMMRVTMDPVISQQRMALDFERLQLDWLSERVKLAALQAQMHQAESDLTRTTGLHANKLVSDEQFEQIRTARDSLVAQFKAQSELVSRIEPSLRSFVVDGGTNTIPSPVAGLRAALKLQEEKLRLTEAQLSPIALVAPIDGVITAINRRGGETIVAGESVFQISSTRAERLVGFLRQPIAVEPKPGMTVEVRTRTFERKRGTATVAQIGAQMEPITPTLLTAMNLPITTAATGLRVHVTNPVGLGLRAGEQVDLVIKN